jgi:holo-[acyl-carrier protein] synthase
MTVVGIGLDATDIPRIERAIARYGDRFLHRIFTEAEIAYCSSRHRSGPHYAARFAAKEAAAKALGTGISYGVTWRDIEVVRGSGPPKLRLHGRAFQHFQRLGATVSLLTITHAETIAIAQVVMASGE